MGGGGGDPYHGGGGGGNTGHGTIYRINDLGNLLGYLIIQSPSDPSAQLQLSYNPRIGP